MAVATMQHPPAHEQAPEYPAIKPGIRRNPVVPFGTRGLLFAGRFPGRPQHRVRQTHRSIQPNRARIRSTRR